MRRSNIRAIMGEADRFVRQILHAMKPDHTTTLVGTLGHVKLSSLWTTRAKEMRLTRPTLADKE